MEDRSMYRAVIEKKKVWLPQTIIEERFLGIQNQSMFPVAETSARIPSKDPVPESAQDHAATVYVPGPSYIRCPSDTDPPAPELTVIIVL